MHREFHLTLPILLFYIPWLVSYAYAFMLSGTLLTKVTLQHLLYPAGGNTKDPPGLNINQPSSGTNIFTPEPNTINDDEVKPRIYVPAYDSGQNGESDNSIAVLYHEEYPSRNRMWSSRKNTTGLLRVTESQWK
jgi:hypothetical protein